MSELNSLLLRAVLETVGEAIITINATGEIVMVNHEAQRIWGYSEEELLGKTLSMLMPERYRQAHRVGLERYLETGKARVLGQRLHLEGLKKDGRVFPLELRIQETRANQQLFFTAAVRDLTEVKLAERRRDAEHRVTRVLAEAATLSDATSSILEAICECLGWQVGAFWQLDRHENVLRCLEIWHEPDVEASEFIELSLSKTFVRGEGLPGRIWASSESTWIKDLTSDMNFPRAPVAAVAGLRAAFGLPILLGGEVLGVMEFFSRQIREPDNSLLAMMDAIGSQIGQFMERMYATEERKEAIVQLQEALDVRDRFLSIAAHELKTPVSSLIGYAQLLERRAQRENNKNERTLKALRALTGQARRLQRLLSSLLDLTRIQANQLTIERGLVDITVLVRRAAEEIQPLLEQHTVKLKGSTKPLLVEGDELRLEQVLHNLLQNAIKYSPGGGLVEITLEEHAGQVLIHVRDQGIGIPPEAMPNLFTRFFRAENASQQQIAGMGIGLFLVRQIVTQHEGNIYVESRAGEGTVFTVALPLCTRPAPADSLALCH